MGMPEIIKEFEAFDIDVHLTIDGLAFLTLITDRGNVAIHMKRQVLESLDARTRRELIRAVGNGHSPRSDPEA